MITYEEALDRIKNFCVGCTNIEDCDNCEFPVIDRALRRRIARKPINVPGSLMGKKFDQYFCPSCYEKRVELHTPHTCMMDYNVTEKMHCCPLCGQEIDWSN